MTLVVPKFLNTPATYSDIPVGASDLRSAYGSMQPGVYAAGDLAVTYGGSGLVVNVAAGAALIPSASALALDRYEVENTASVASSSFDGGALAAAHATLPRIDQIIARVYDHSIDGSTRREWVLQKVTGTATSGATLANRTGAAALPSSSCLRLADVLVPAAATTIASANIRDRRPWARGAFGRVLLNTPDQTAVWQTMTVLSAFDTRLEVSGGPVRLTLSGEYSFVAATHRGFVKFWIDGGLVDGGAGGVFHAPYTGNEDWFTMSHVTAPAAGSHVFSIAATVDNNAGGSPSNNFLLLARSAQPLTYTIDELVRPLASNNATTG